VTGRKKALGRGLEALLPDLETESGGSRTETVSIGRIDPNPFQPRQHFDPAGLEELASSIQTHGILQPLVVRPSGTGFELVAGERRWRAARQVGLVRVPVVVREGVSDEQMLELALVENVQRRDLDPIERARGFQALIDRLGLTQEEVAGRVGLQRSTVTNHLRLLELPGSIQEAVAKGLLTMGHARAMLGLPGERDMQALLEAVVREDLSVRDVERRVREQTSRRRVKVGAASKEPPAAPQAPPPWVAELERRMREHLGTKVSVQPTGPAQGRIVIDYYDRDTLDRICDILAPRPKLPL